MRNKFFNLPIFPEFIYFRIFLDTLVVKVVVLYVETKN